MKTITFVGGPSTIDGKTVNVDDSVTKVVVLTSNTFQFFDTDLTGDVAKAGYVGEFFNQVQGAIEIPVSSLT